MADETDLFKHLKNSREMAIRNVGGANPNPSAEDATAEEFRISETSYRRGFEHAVRSMTALIGGHDGALQAAYLMRRDGKPHPGYVDDFMAQAKTGPTYDDVLSDALEAGILLSPGDANALFVHSVTMRSLLQIRNSWPDNLDPLTSVQVLEALSLVINAVALGSSVSLPAILQLVSQDFKAAVDDARNEAQA